MTALGKLVLVLGLLVSARCEVRDRDPEEVEEERRGGTTISGAAEAPPVAARSGNRCAFVKNRVVTLVKCSSQKYPVRSLTPCDSSDPDCRRRTTTHKLSERPRCGLHKNVVTALEWHCCPGYGGADCEEPVGEARRDARTAALQASRVERRAPGVRLQQQQQLQHGVHHREQSDDQAWLSTPTPALPHNDTHTVPDSGHPHSTHGVHGVHGTHGVHGAHSVHGTQGTQGPTADPPPLPRSAADELEDHLEDHLEDPLEDHLEDHLEDKLEAVVSPYHDVPSALPVPHMMALVMSQLQPVLEGFNRSLEHLAWQVNLLAGDVSQLKSSQLEAESRMAAPAEPELHGTAEERLEAKLDEVFRQLRELRGQLEGQRAHIETGLHSQHAMLHYNLTSFKTDLDMKMKRQQKALQVSLQAVNSTLAELKVDRDRLPGDTPDTAAPIQHSPSPPDTAAIWEAIDRLDNAVVSNIVKVDGLVEDVDVASGSVRSLKQDLKALEELANQTARNAQIQYMETGLEVEAAKVTVLTRVGELAGNLSQQGQRLQDMDVDVDYLYTVLYRNTSSSDCDCKGLKAAVARLERRLENVTELANQNRLSLEEDGGGAEQWVDANDWEPAVDALQRGLQQVKEALMAEQSRTRTLDQSLTRLGGAVSLATAEVAGLKDTDGRLTEDMRHLSSSFNSLLKDAIRHSDVLELMMGEEILEFLEWPIHEQEANSIPALREQMRSLQEQLKEQSGSIGSLLGRRQGGSEEVPSADQPSSSWSDVKRSSGGAPVREQQLLLPPGGDGGDLWKLEKVVQELKLKVLHLEEKPCDGCSAAGREAALQAEVMWLKRGLEEHLRTFKNIFSNADVLANSDATLELDKLWQLVKKKERRAGGEHRRNKRVAEGDLHRSDPSLLFFGRFPSGASRGVVTFEESVNRRRFYAGAGTFSAPASGRYLFVLTLDLQPGDAHLVLRSDGGEARTLLREVEQHQGPITRKTILHLEEGEEMLVELRSGAWTRSEDNVMGVKLIHQDA